MRQAPYPVIRCDPNQCTGDATTPEAWYHEVLAPERGSLVEWLEAWLDDEQLFYTVFNNR